MPVPSASPSTLHIALCILKRARLVFVLAHCLLTSGCALTNRVANYLAMSNEMRCGTGACSTAQVSLQPPQGYLAAGTTFTGSEITGPAGKTAVDTVLELKDELTQSQRECEELRQQLELAQATIQQRDEAIDEAGKELQHALQDYSRMRSTLTQWYGDLRELDHDYQRSQDEEDATLDALERDLKLLIEKCETAMGTVDASTQDVSSDEPAAVHEAPVVEHLAPIVQGHQP